VCVWVAAVSDDVVKHPCSGLRDEAYVLSGVGDGGVSLVITV